MKIRKDVTTVLRETTVNFLKKPEVSFVSLVKHGANNTPFRTIKSNKEGMMNKVVQAIRVNKDSKADLEALVGKEFRKDTKVEEGNYIIYEQVDKSVCDLGTKSVVVLDPENHVYAITYDLLVDKESDEIEDKKGIISDAVILNEDVKEISYWDVWDEMYAMTDIISGSMSQSTRSTENRKDAVIAAIDNFRSFCETVFTEMKSVSPLPIEKRLGGGTSKLTEIAQKYVSVKQGKEGGNMFELESKEELVKIISEVAISAIQNRADADAKSIEAKAKVEEEAKTAEVKEKEINDLKESVKTLSETIEKLSGTVISKTNDAEIDTTELKKGANVYTGMFGGLRSTPGGISGAA